MVCFLGSVLTEAVLKMIDLIGYSESFLVVM